MSTSIRSKAMRAAVRATTVLAVAATSFVVGPVVHGEEAPACGSDLPDRAPDASPYQDNQVWADPDDGVHYGAPGGATPRREASVSPEGSVGVTVSQDLAGGVSIGIGPDGRCQDVALGGPPPPNDSEATCGKPYGGPLTVRPANAEQPEFDWNDTYRELEVTMTSARTCATLAGVLHGPADIEDRSALPAVLVLPPSGGVATVENMGYIAKSLAGAGYVTLTVEPQGTGRSDGLAWPPCGTESGASHPSPCEGQPFQRMDNWMEAARTGLDFLLGETNPWATHVDASRVGATGHSLGARAASYLQDPALDLGDPDADPRIHAVVGLDNLSANYYGDGSADSHNGVLNEGNDLELTNRAVNGQPMGGDLPISITVPGLGLGSDDERTSPDDKKAAARSHAAGGVPSGMLIFEGAAHGDFSQSASSEETLLFRIRHYTLAWFDLWLRDGADAALERLLSRDVDGVDVGAFLSDTERSGFYRIDTLEDPCEDWRAGCERIESVGWSLPPTARPPEHARAPGKRGA